MKTSTKVIIAITAVVVVITVIGTAYFGAVQFSEYVKSDNESARYIEDVDTFCDNLTEFKLSSKRGYSRTRFNCVVTYTFWINSGDAKLYADETGRYVSTDKIKLKISSEYADQIDDAYGIY